MAPELHFTNSVKTEKCDVYSIGVTLYFMIFGRFPFNDASPYDADYKLLCSQKSKFWKNKKQISCDLRHLLESMMDRC